MDSGGRMVMYLFGILLAIAALAYGAWALGVPRLWIGVGALLLLGFGIAGAASRTRSVEHEGHTEIHHHH